MTPAQLVTLKAALLAETDSGVVAALAIRNDVALTEWCNTASTTDAWSSNVSDKDIFEACDVTKFDSLTAGKRESQTRLERYAPIDFTKQKMRKAIQDIWGNTDSIPILQAFTRKATNGELYFGGTVVTTNTVSATKLNVPGQISMNDVSNALNAA